MKKITSRIKIISFILSFLLISLIAITAYLNQQSKHDGYVVNIVGKERMLTQKMAKELFLNLQRGQSDMTAFTEAKTEFLGNLGALQNGTADGKISPPPNNDIAGQLERIRVQSDQFLALADSVKAKIELNTQPDEAELNHLYRINNELLEKIDRTVQAYSLASEEKIERLQMIQYIGAFITLIAVAASIVFTRQIDDEFDQFLNNAKEVSQIRCDEGGVESVAASGPQNELMQAESDMKTFLVHVEKVLAKAQYALIESQNTLIQIEGAARTMELQLDEASISEDSKEEISDYIDKSEILTINSLEKIASTQKMLDKFHGMIEKIVVKMDQPDKA